MAKLDIKLAKFHDRAKQLRQEIINQLNQTHDVLDETYLHYPEHPMTKVEILLGEFKRTAMLNYRHSTIRGNKVEISAMFSKKGNKLVSDAIRKFTGTCYDNPKAAVKLLSKELEEIKSEHPEITDTAVREQIYWYTEPFFEIYALKD
jgi:hypothetical protein